MAKESQNWFVELIKTLVFALGFVVVIHTTLIKPFVIPTPSMVPSLLIGDYLFVTKFPYGYSNYSIPFSPDVIEDRIWSSEPKRGDVVVFRPLHDTGTDWIKRLIGLPGDRVQMIDGVLHINNTPVTLEEKGDFVWKDQHGRSYDSQLYVETLPNGVEHLIIRDGDRRKDNSIEFLVPQGHYFMMGDNRDHSDDSRFPTLGFVPHQNLVGRAEIIFFSTSLPTDDGAWWMIWRWPFDTRYSRFFNIIR